MATKDYKSRVEITRRGKAAERSGFVKRKPGPNRNKFGQPARKLHPRALVVLAVVAVGFLGIYSLIKWLRGEAEPTAAVTPVAETTKAIPLPVPPAAPKTPEKKAEKPGSRTEPANKTKETATTAVAVPLPDPAAALPAAAPPAAPPKKAEPPAPVVRVKPPEPRFTFYKILPDQEVIIPEQDIRTMKQNAPASSIQFTLQVGSSLQLDEAKKTQEKLSQIKIKSQIENIEIDSALWYRVKVGPFKTLEDADKVRLWLRTNKIDSVVQQKKIDH